MAPVRINGVCMEAEKRPGIFKSTLLGDDGRSPSSARLLGSILVVGVVGLQITLTIVFLVLLLRLDTTQPNTVALATAYVGVLRLLLLHSLLIDTLTALSFYGINAWKYYFGLQTGGHSPSRVGPLAPTPPVVPADSIGPTRIG